jgi:hypothetical protein
MTMAGDNDVARHVARNEQLVAKIQELCGNLQEDRVIDFFFYAPMEHEARQLAAELHELAFVNVHVAERPANWVITAERHASVADITEESFVAQLASLASKCHAEFDGWGTAQLIGLFTASGDAKLMTSRVGVSTARWVARPRSGCGKEFSWTKQRAYVGKVSDREGRVVERRSRGRLPKGSDSRTTPPDTATTGNATRGETIDMGVLTPVQTKLPQDRFTVRQRERPENGGCHDESNQVRGR